MSLNIQTANGLLEIGGKVTKEKVISALGYEPANKTHTENTTVHVTSAEKETWNNKSDVKHYEDLEGAPSITENDSGSMVIADESGNIIMQVDADGLATTNVSARTISLGGEDLGVRLDELEANMVSSIIEDESGKVEFTDEAGYIIARISVDGFETTQVMADTVIANGVNVEEKFDEINERINNISIPSIDGLATETYVDEKIDTHKSDKVVHITSDERVAWNAKSDFSGDYNELINAPNIIEDSSGSVVYSDEQGYIIAKIDANGLETTTVTTQSVIVNGTDVKVALDGKADSIHTHEQYLEVSDIVDKADKSYVDTEIAAAKLDASNKDVAILAAAQSSIKTVQDALSTHTDDTVAHITANERTTWNAKSDFSGSYNDLENAPNITEDESNELVVSDRNGNIIFRTDANGLETTTVAAKTVIVNGVDITEIGVGKKGAGTNAEIFNDYTNNVATDSYAHAEGYNTRALGTGSHAEGGMSDASGMYSHAEGNGTVASGDRAHSEGSSTTASGDAAHAEGGGTTASGDNAHSEGSSTTASGTYSHAEGSHTTASKYAAHAEGYKTTASEQYTHAEGFNTIASGRSQHVQGVNNIEDTDNKYAHIVGNGAIFYDNSIQIDTPSNAHTLDWEGNAWFAGDVYVGSTSGTNKDEGSVKLATIDELNVALEGVGGGAVDSVNGKTGAVVLTLADLGIEIVDSIPAAGNAGKFYLVKA